MLCDALTINSNKPKQNKPKQQKNLFLYLSANNKAHKLHMNLHITRKKEKNTKFEFKDC